MSLEDNSRNKNSDLSCIVKSEGLLQYWDRISFGDAHAVLWYPLVQQHQRDIEIV